jgi:hypothetical protein
VAWIHQAAPTRAGGDLILGIVRIVEDLDIVIGVSVVICGGARDERDDGGDGSGNREVVDQHLIDLLLGRWWSSMVTLVDSHTACGSALVARS